MLWFAHRGVSDRFPENTLEAIAAAIKMMLTVSSSMSISQRTVSASSFMMRP